MKIVGLITEYNPFHNGHAYHIDQAKCLTGADYVIAVMSGDFVQRGAPAVIDKYQRAQMALKHGVDLVFELPVCYSTGSAEYFAHGAAALLNQLGIINYLCFGSESGDIDQLKNAAQILCAAPASMDEQLLSYIKSGMSYPAARQKAFLEHLAFLNHSKGTDAKTNILTQLITQPNNILGIEYMKALNQLSSSIIPVTIKRQSAHYHDAELSSHVSTDESKTVISSASAIRKIFHSMEDVSGMSAAKNSLPDDVYELLSDQYKNTFPITVEDFAAQIRYRLLAENHHSLTQYADITGDLADRIKNKKDYNLSIPELCMSLKTKNLTMTRINRSLMHLLLNIHSDSLKFYCENGYIFYARLLGMRKESSHLLKKIEASSRIPIISKLSKAKEHLDKPGMQMLSEDIFAANVYNQAVYEKYHTSLSNEYQRGIIIL